MTKYYKIENGKALDIPVPQEIDGLSREDLADLSFTPIELGLRDAIWWPALEVGTPVPLGHKLTDEDSFELDHENKQVLVSKVIRLWTEEEFKDFQAKLCEDINKAVVDAISSSTRFSLEYVRREAQARSYIEQIDALEPNAEIPPAPRLIANFATSANVDQVYAARLTIAQADALYDIQDQLADLRMRKYEIERTTTVLEASVLTGQILNAIDAVAKTIT